MIYLDMKATDVYSHLVELKGKIDHFPVDAVGEIIVRHVKERIWEIPLYKTGALYDSIDYQYGSSEAEVIVDAGVPYAEYLDQGTKYIEAYHFLEITPECDSEIDDFLGQFWGDDYKPWAINPQH